MKKYTFFAVALATIAFVGCNKDNKFVPDENGMVSIMLSGEKHVSQDKQAFSGQWDQIFFTNEDSMYVNGGACAITCIPNGDGTSTTESNLGSVAIPAELVYNPLYAFYPTSVFTPGTAADYSDWTVTMKNNVVLISPDAEAGVRTPMSAIHQNWPLTAYVPDVTTNDNVQLKNNVALMTPAVKYGHNFVRDLTRNRLTGETFDGTNYPTLVVEKVVLSSSNTILTGTGHIEHLNSSEPYLVMDGEMPTADNPDVMTLFVGDPDANPGMEVAPTGNYTTNLGHAPIAPITDEANHNIHIALHFSLTYPGTNNTYNCVYEGDGIFNNTNVIRRQRTTLTFDLFSELGVSKITSIQLAE